MKKYYRFEIDTVVGNILAIVLLIIFSFTFYFINIDTIDYIMLFITMGLLFFYLALHELLHGIAYNLTGVPKEKITYGVLLEKGILYCLTKYDTSKKSVLTSLLTPFTIIGVITLLISIIINNPVLWFLSVFNISGCASDISMFIYILSIKDKNLKYRELDDGYSFVITTTADLEKKKNIGIKLVEVIEEENDSIIPKDLKKFKISKLSCILSLCLFILVIVGFLLCLI